MKKNLNEVRYELKGFQAWGMVKSWKVPSYGEDLSECREGTQGPPDVPDGTKDVAHLTKEGRSTEEREKRSEVSPSQQRSANDHGLL